MRSCPWGDDAPLPVLFLCSPASFTQTDHTASAVVPQALKTTYHVTPQYIEVDIDISANNVASYVTGLVRGATKSLVIDMGGLFAVVATFALFRCFTLLPLVLWGPGRSCAGVAKALFAHDGESKCRLSAACSAYSSPSSSVTRRLCAGGHSTLGAARGSAGHPAAQLPGHQERQEGGCRLRSPLSVSSFKLFNPLVGLACHCAVQREWRLPLL